MEKLQIKIAKLISLSSSMYNILENVNKNKKVNQNELSVINDIVMKMKEK